MMTVMTAIMCPVFVCGKQYSVSQLALHLVFVFVWFFLHFNFWISWFYYRTGAALTTNICLESLPVVNIEETVHDVANPSHDAARKEPPPEAIKILVEDDVVGHPASIVYHDCLRQLAEYIVLPMTKCTAKDPVTKQQCCAQPPFEVDMKSRGTAALVEWVSLHILGLISISVIL